ncbi:Peptidase_C39 like family protein [Micromonospora echinofusca]|uniref:Peptidase_C39 like family protein n=1 Tax=Micromonospora echinofusca TaxID=47858 RepID=A0A1C5GD93_MICEH|nr:peptidase C39 family protein [Micromonospora echinofusca]SCG17668.1 Peptidase_C39 like family protein [Micromonospora echinofusca]
MTDAAPTIRRDVTYRGFRLPDDAALGETSGLRAGGRGLELADPADRLEHTDADGRTRRYAAGSWTSPPVPVGFAVRDVVPSWTGDTPGDCWLRVELRGWHDDAPATGWYVLADWAADDHALRRTTVPGQRDADARVDTDTLLVTDATVTGWQVRVTLLRPEDADATPVLRAVGAVAAGPRPTATTGPSRPAREDAPPTGWGTVLDVPRYSQRLHAGSHPQWGGGGDSWCSPTCTSMVLAFWGAAPAPTRYAWVAPAGPRPVVVHAARHCYDHAYAGAGNWAFNTAYAGLHGVDAFVTRLRSLTEAEAFVAAGIPLIVSAAFTAGQVPGLDYDTAGHLMVLVGFTDTGAPVLNDPYAPDDDAVRRIVDRDRFEAAWQGGSGGVAYVLRPPGVPLPPAPEQPNW